MSCNIASTYVLLCVYIYTNIYIHHISAFHSILVFLPFNCRTSQAWTATTTGEMGDTYPSSQQSGIGEEPMQRTSPTKAVEQNIPRFGSCQNTGFKAVDQIPGEFFVPWNFIQMNTTVDSHKKKQTWQVLGLGRPQYQNITKNWSVSTSKRLEISHLEMKVALLCQLLTSFKETFSVE